MTDRTRTTAQAIVRWDMEGRQLTVQRRRMEVDDTHQTTERLRYRLTGARLAELRAARNTAHDTLIETIGHEATARALHAVRSELDHEYQR